MLTREERIAWNDRLRAGPPRSSPMPFRCECTDDECIQVVYLRTEEYDEAKQREPSGVKAPRHRAIAA
jgi:hypothetical protein